jgi:hypothetical protein
MLLLVLSVRVSDVQSQHGRCFASGNEPIQHSFRHSSQAHTVGTCIATHTTQTQKKSQLPRHQSYLVSPPD